MTTRVKSGGGVVGGGTEGKDTSVHLTEGPINLSILREYYRQQLTDLLSERPGAKAVVLDRALEGHLNLICDYDYPKFFKSLGDIEALHYLSDDLYSSSSQLVYICQPTIPNMRLIAAHIITHKETEKLHVYTVLLTPRKTMLCERELHEQGVWEDIGKIGEFQLELIPMECDVLSLENERAFRELYLDGDSACLYTIARSLMKIQTVYGQIPMVKGKGVQAQKVWQLMQRMRREWPIQPLSTINNPASVANAAAAAIVPTGISALLLLDRSLDLLTPVITPHTYEGFIDELFQIKYNVVEVPASVLNPNTAQTYNRADSSSSSPSASSSSTNKKKVLLTNNDGVFAEIRSMAFKQLGTFLHKKAEFLKSTYDEKAKQNTIKELSNYLSRFKSAHHQHQFLSTHINLSTLMNERIKDKLFDMRLDIERNMLDLLETEQCEEYIEACIGKQAPLLQVLRLLIMMSLTTGIRNKKYDVFKRDILQTYGFTTWFTLQNLEKLGLLSNNKKTSYANVKKMLRLVVPASSVQGEHADINYVYNGYAPLLCRLAEQAMRPGWKRMDEVMTLLNGPLFEYRQDGREDTQGVPITVSSIMSSAALVNATPPVAVPASSASSHGTSTPTAAASATSTSATSAHHSGLRGWLDKKAKREGKGDKDTIATPHTDGTITTISATADGGHAGGQSTSGAGTITTIPSSTVTPSTAVPAKIVLLVVFIGGVTFAEIAALRSLSARDDHDYYYIIATTRLLSAQALPASVQEQIKDEEVEKKFRRSIFLVTEEQ